MTRKYKKRENPYSADWVPPVDPRGPQPLHDGLTGAPLRCERCGKVFYSASEMARLGNYLVCRFGCDSGDDSAA